MNLLREEDEIEVSDALLNSPVSVSIFFNANFENLLLHKIDYSIFIATIIFVVLFSWLFDNLLILWREISVWSLGLSTNITDARDFA